MNAIDIGIIGAGNMGKNHIRLTSEMPEFRLVGIFDPGQNTQDLAEQYGIARFQSVEKLMDRVQAVVIACPSSLHYETALLAASHGIHALVEKPLSLNEKDAQSIKEKFDESGKLLAVGHVERFNAVVTEAVKLIEDEEVVAINARRFSPVDLRINDSDVVQDLMIHDLDILVNILNKSPVKKTQAFGRPVYNKEFIDYATALLEFENGVLASVSASRTTEDKVRAIDIHTRSSYVRMDLLDKTLNITRRTSYKLDTGHNIAYKQENIIERVYIPLVEPLRAELANFAFCINKNIKPSNDAASAIYTIRILDAIRGQIYMQNSHNPERSLNNTDGKLFYTSQC